MIFGESGMGSPSRASLYEGPSSTNGPKRYLAPVGIGRILVESPTQLLTSNS